MNNEPWPSLRSSPANPQAPAPTSPTHLPPMENWSLATLPGMTPSSSRPQAPMPTRRCRVLVANFFVERTVPKEGDVINLPADLARAMVQQGRIEYVDVT